MIDQYNKWRMEYEASKTEKSPPAKQMFDYHDFNVGLKIGAGAYAVQQPDAPTARLRCGLSNVGVRALLA